MAGESNIKLWDQYLVGRLSVCWKMWDVVKKSQDRAKKLSLKRLGHICLKRYGCGLVNDDDRFSQ